MRVMARFVHKISSRDTDVYGPYEIPARTDLTAKTLGLALRKTKCLIPGQAIRAFRVESDGRIVVFPKASIWHSIILTEQDDTPCAECDPSFGCFDGSAPCCKADSLMGVK